MTQSRRNFLKDTGITTAGFLLLHAFSRCAPTKKIGTDEEKIAVIADISAIGRNFLSQQAELTKSAADHPVYLVFYDPAEQDHQEYLMTAQETYFSYYADHKEGQTRRQIPAQLLTVDIRSHPDIYEFYKSYLRQTPQILSLSQDQAGPLVKENPSGEENDKSSILRQIHATEFMYRLHSLNPHLTPDQK
jgi:hypothetical protein